MLNPKLAAVLSFFIPGLGQALSGDVKRGIMFFIIYVVLSIVLFFIFYGAIPSKLINCLYSIYAAYDAYRMANA